MSRTDKDLPYWVMTRTPAKGVSVSVWHNHSCFGRPIFRWRLKEDADGVPVIERTETVVGYDENYRPIVSVYEREVRERVLVAHFPDECVVDYGSPHNKRKFGVFTCEAYLENWDYYARKRPHGKSGSHSLYGPWRAAERGYGRSVVKAYRAGVVDFDGSDFGEDLLPVKRVKGWRD